MDRTWFVFSMINKIQVYIKWPSSYLCGGTYADALLPKVSWRILRSSRLAAHVSTPTSVHKQRRSLRGCATPRLNKHRCTRHTAHASHTTIASSSSSTSCSSIIINDDLRCDNHASQWVLIYGGVFFSSKTHVLTLFRPLDLFWEVCKRISLY